MRRVASVIFLLAVAIATAFAAPNSNLTSESAGPAATSSRDAAYQHLSEVMDKYHTAFDVYTDVGAAGNHFVHRGRMSSDGGGDLVLIEDTSTENPHSGATCIKNTLLEGYWNWGGWYFLNGVLPPGYVKPVDNWGEYPEAGFDLSGATKLTFWARGAVGGERVEFFLAGVGRDALTGEPLQGFPYPDSSRKISTGFITLANSWQEYTINVAGKDLSYVLGGFGWATSTIYNPAGIVFYLDDIKFDLPRLDEPRFLRSYETLAGTGDFETVLRNVAFTYDNALALLAYMGRGQPDDWRRAGLLADALVYAQEHDRSYDDGRLRNAYQAGDLVLFPGWIPNNRVGTVRMPGWWDPVAQRWYEDRVQVGSYTGNVAWAMIALLAYYEAKGGEQYLEAARRMGEWVESCCRDERGAGGYTGGYDGWEPTPTPLTWKSTEHNIDVYVAFSRLYLATLNPSWLARAAHARAFVQAMWYDAGGHFWTGTLDDGVTPNKQAIPTDVNTWGLMALGNQPKYGRAVDWVETNCSLEHHGFQGFDFNAFELGPDRDGVWFEGTAHMVIAYRLVGEEAMADLYLGEIRRAQTEASNNNGKGIVAACHDGLTTGFDWLYFNRLHVGATAWYLLAEGRDCPLCQHADGDGFDDAVETYLGTDPLDACPDDPTDDAWPLDVSRDGQLNVVADILELVGRIGATPGAPNWWQRLDYNADGQLSVVGDVLMYRNLIGETCT